MPVDKGKRRADDAAVSLGEAIREARTAAEPLVTQETLESALKVNQSTLSRWERGSGEPNLTQIGQIEDKLNLPRGWLLVRSGAVTISETPEGAIAADRRLTARYRQQALDALRFVLSQSKAGR